MKRAQVGEVLNVYLRPVATHGNCFPPANETLEHGLRCYFWHVPAGHIDTSLALSFSNSLSPSQTHSQ